MERAGKCSSHGTAVRTRSSRPSSAARFGNLEVPCISEFGQYLRQAHTLWFTSTNLYLLSFVALLMPMFSVEPLADHQVLCITKNWNQAYLCWWSALTSLKLQREFSVCVSFQKYPTKTFLCLQHYSRVSIFNGFSWNRLFVHSKQYKRCPLSFPICMGNFLCKTNGFQPGWKHYTGN